MSTLAYLSILRLPDAYFFQLHLPGSRQPAATLAALQPLLPGQSTLPQQVEEGSRLLNRLLAQRRVLNATKAGAPAATDPADDPLRSLGRLLYNQLLPSVIQQALRALPDDTSVLLSTNSPEAPWELLHDGIQFLALKHPVGRQLLVATPPRQNPPPAHQLRTILLIGNPTGDLPQAEAEIEQLLTLLETIPDVAVPVVLMGKRAGKAAVLKQLASGAYDVIHYSGHACFDPAQPLVNGLLLAGDTLLSAQEIQQNLAGQPLVFLNGCQSAPLVEQPTTGHVNQAAIDWGLGLAGLAAAFVQGGAQSVVGTLWPIADAGARPFALTFHKAAFQGETIGRALQQARQALAAPNNPVWASYLLYGDPTITVVRPPAAARHPATVLVVRLLGVDTLMGNQPPDLAAAVLAAYLTRLTETIEAADGQVQSVAYGTLIALFALPKTQENDAERALYAALAIRKASQPLQRQWGAQALGIACGLSSGVVWLETRQPGPLAHSILIGAAVATANELAQQAAANEILLAEATYRLASTRFQRQTLPASSIQGASVYKFIGQRTDVDSGATMADDLLPIVGRQAELALLDDAWQRCCAGQGQIVDIVGEAGIGKTRLLQAFYQRLGAAATWLLVACPSAYTVGAYWAIGQLVRIYLGLTSDEPSALMRNKLQAAFTQQPPENLAVVGDLLGVDFPATPVRHLEQPIYQRHLVDALTQWLLALSTPLILVLEDVHRIDESSLAILKQLVARLDQAPVLVLALFRLEGAWQSPWRQRRNYRLLQLRTLDREEGRQFVAALLATEQVASAVAEMILTPAEGNPFFMRELLFSLRTAGVLHCHQGVWQLARALQPQDIPDSLDRLIRLRVNSTTEKAQRVLALLAVAGDSCDYAVLQHALAQTQAEPWLAETVAELTEKELIRQHWTQGRQQCYFPHALIQAVIYESLRNEERRRYHQRLGRTLRELYPEREGEMLELLAHHAYHSVTTPGHWGSPATVSAAASAAQLQHAALLLGQAGAQAQVRYAPRQAARYYQQALEVSATLAAIDPLARADAYEGLGDAQALLGEFSTATNAYTAAFTILTSLPVSPLLRRRAADLARRIGRLLGKQHQVAQGHVYMAKGLALLGDPQSDAEVATAALIHTHTGSLYYLQKQMQPAEHACRTALALVEAWENGEVTATAANVLGVVCMVTGRWTEAVTRYEQSLAIWQRLGQQPRAAEVMDNLGNLQFLRGEFAVAEELYRANLHFFASIEANDHIGYATLCLGGVDLVLGRWAAARDADQRALALFLQTHNLQLVALTHNNLGFLELACQNFPAALAYFQESIAVDCTPENLRGASETHLALGNLEQALAYAEQSLTLARAEDLRFEEGVTLRTLGAVAQACNDLSNAADYLATSCTVLQQLGAHYEWGRSLLQQARLAEALGQTAFAQEQSAHALRIFARLGVPETEI